MNLYPDEEIKRIEKAKETNDKLEEFFKQKRDSWNESIKPLFDVLRMEFNQTNIRKITDSQASSLSFKQIITEEISLFLDKRSKEEVKLKRIKQDKFIFFSTGFGLKTNLGEKSILIDGNLAENERTIMAIDNYVEFLRASTKNLSDLQYSLKNIIELMGLLSK